jgi:type I site-specific restriction endonuclease
MHQLNFPRISVRLKEADGKVWIFDGIRKKFIVLTPEEWVRQHLVQYMVLQKGYPKSLIKIEGGLSYNQLSKRSDVVVYDKSGKPWLVAECKAPIIELTEKTVRQAFVYNQTLKARYVVLSNGIKHLCFDASQGPKAIPEFPEFGK